MFLKINDVPYSIYAISSFNKTSEVVDDPETPRINYFIVYQMSNGNVIKEQYESAEARNQAYDILIDKLVVKLDEETVQDEEESEESES